MKLVTAAALSGATLMSACAAYPNSIQASYVSPNQYANYSCEQLVDERARVRLAFSRVVGGRLVRRMTIAFAGRAGVNRRRFAGRRLAPGRYVVAVTASDATGRVSRPALLRFRIVR